MQNCNFSDRFVSETGLKNTDFVSRDAMLIMWTMTRTMGTIQRLRTMMQIAPSMKMIMNLCKQDRLNAWGNLQVAFYIVSTFKK